MKQLNIPAGTQVLIAPLQSVPSPERTARLLDVIAACDGVSEAHLTQCFAIGVMEDPAPVLTLVLDPGKEIRSVLRQLASAPVDADEDLDVWILRPNDPVLKTLRQARSRIYPPVTQS